MDVRPLFVALAGAGLNLLSLYLRRRLPQRVIVALEWFGILLMLSGAALAMIHKG